MKAKPGDAEILAAMRKKPVGSVRNAWERFAFEREWDDRVEAAK